MFQWFGNLLSSLRKTFSKFINIFRSTESKEAARQRELDRIMARVDYALIPVDLPFFKKTAPDDAKGRIEYLGELMVEIEKREISLKGMTDKIIEKREEILKDSYDHLIHHVAGYFDVCRVSICQDIEKEYSIVGEMGETVSNAWRFIKSKFSKQKERIPDNFLTRILVRHVGEEQVRVAVQTAINETAVKIAKDWNSFVAKDWDTGLKGTVKLQGIRLDWNDTVDFATKGALAAAGGTVVLAMGWHTLAWASAHFFPPAMLVVAVGTLLKALFDKKKEIRKLQDKAVEVVGVVESSTLRYLQQEAYPKMKGDIHSFAENLVQKANLQIWESVEDVQPTISKWRHLVRTTFEAARVKITSAEASHLMRVALNNANAEYKHDQLILAARYYEYTFFYLLNWCSVRFNVPLDSRERKDFQMDFIGALGKAGFSPGLRERMHRLRKFRNLCSKESLSIIMREPAKFKRDLGENLELLKKTIDDVEGMKNDR